MTVTYSKEFIAYGYRKPDTRRVTIKSDRRTYVHGQKLFREVKPEKIAYHHNGFFDFFKSRLKLVHTGLHLRFSSRTVCHPSFAIAPYEARNDYLLLHNVLFFYTFKTYNTRAYKKHMTISDHYYTCYYC